MNILEEIYNYKLDFVKRAKTLRSLDELIDQSNAIKKKNLNSLPNLRRMKRSILLENSKRLVLQLEILLMTTLT